MFLDAAATVPLAIDPVDNTITLTLTGGQQSVDFFVQAIDDSIPELDEFFTVTIVDAASSGTSVVRIDATQDSDIGTILDDDVFEEDVALSLLSEVDSVGEGVATGDAANARPLTTASSLGGGLADDLLDTPFVPTS